MKRTFTFNKPIVFLYMAPMLALVVFLTIGLVREFNFFVLFMILVSLGLLTVVFWLSFLRRMVVSGDQVEWITPQKHFTLKLSEVNHYGIVKFRNFRFIYVSKMVEPPFESPESRVISNENTFIIQFRRKAYYYLESQLHRVNPSLEPIAYRKDY